VYFKSQSDSSKYNYTDKVFVHYDTGAVEVELVARPHTNSKRLSLVLHEDNLNSAFKKRMISSRVNSSKRIALQKKLSDSEPIIENTECHMES
jgi:hypothetical protein